MKSFSYIALAAILATPVMAKADQTPTDYDPIDIDRFPQILVAAVEAAEDPEFRQYMAWRSPITAQVARLLQPPRKTDHMDVFFDAVKLDRSYDHDEILALYLENAYFGRGCRGAHAASNGLFEKELDNITVAESIILAALLRRPSGGFADDRFMQESAMRITTTMQQNGTITSDEIDQILIEISRRTIMGRRC